MHYSLLTFTDVFSGIDIFIGLPLPYFHRAARQKFPPQWKLITWLFDTVHRPLLFAFLNKDSVEYRSAHSVDVMGKVRRTNCVFCYTTYFLVRLIFFSLLRRVCSLRKVELIMVIFNGYCHTRLILPSSLWYKYPNSSRT